MEEFGTNEEYSNSRNRYKFYKLIRAEESPFFNKIVKMIAVPKIGTVTLTEVNGNYYCATSPETKRKLVSGQFSYLFGLADIQEDFLWEYGKPDIFKQMITDFDFEDKINLAWETQTPEEYDYKYITSCDTATKDRIYREICNLVRKYFASFGINIHGEIFKDSQRSNLICVKLFEVSPGEASEVLWVTKKYGITALVLRMDENKRAYLKVESLYSNLLPK